MHIYPLKGFNFFFLSLQWATFPCLITSWKPDDHRRLNSTQQNFSSIFMTDSAWYLWSEYTTRFMLQGCWHQFRIMNISGYKNLSHNKYKFLIKVLYIVSYRWMYHFNLLSAAVMIRIILRYSQCRVRYIRGLD